VKFQIVFITIIAISLPAVAASSTLEKALCAKSSDNIQATLDNINMTDGWIELVPPDEAAFFSKEYKAALDDVEDGGRRYSLVVTRPYFHAWQLHESFAKARRQVEAVQRQMTGKETLKNKIMWAVLASHLVSDARLAYHEFITAENIHSQKMLDSDAVLAAAESGINMYLNCLIEKLDDK
jgi:hypothetical protein